MYITEIQIRNLINFQGDHTVSFPVTEDGIPNDVYVLVGQNNSGKSSLLQLARACTDTGSFEREWKGINVPKGNSYGIVMCRMKSFPEENITTAFYKTQDFGLYLWAKVDTGNVLVITFMKLTSTGDGTEEKYCVTESKIMSSYKLDDIINDIKNATMWKTRQELHLNRLPWEEKECKPQVIQSDSQSITRGVKNDYRKLEPKIREKVDDFIRRIGYQHYKAHSTGPGNMAVTDESTGLKFDFDWLPDGHQYLWSMAIKMHDPITKCLIVDEPTRSMHPSLVHHLSAEMKEYCREHGLQFIITSHSPAVVRGLRLSNVFLATRLQDGTTNIRAFLDGKSSEEANQRAMNIVDKRMEDSLFSRLVMIVEGESDRRLLSMFLSRLSRMKRDDFGEILGQVPNQHQCTTEERLSTFRGLIRDVTVVSAGTKAAIGSIIKPLEFFGIPYFMVVDGDFVWSRKAQKEKNIPPADDIQPQMHALFESCDLLRDGASLKALEALFSEGYVSGSVEGKQTVSHLWKRMESHDYHKSGVCKDCTLDCKSSEGDVIGTGCRSMARKCLKCVTEIAFMVERAKEERTKEELGKMKKDDRKSLTETIFRKRTKLLQDWFRLFTWQHEEPYHLESLVRPVIKDSVQLKDAYDDNKTDGELNTLLCHGFTEREMLILVDEMCEGLISKDLENFLRFLENRILNYYSEHGSIRELKLERSSVELERKEGHRLEAKCTLLIKHDGRSLESSRAENL